MRPSTCWVEIPRVLLEADMRGGKDAQSAKVQKREGARGKSAGGTTRLPWRMGARTPAQPQALQTCKRVNWKTCKRVKAPKCNSVKVQKWTNEKTWKEKSVKSVDRPWMMGARNLKSEGETVQTCESANVHTCERQEGEGHHTPAVEDGRAEPAHLRGGLVDVDWVVVAREAVELRGGLGEFLLHLCTMVEAGVGRSSLDTRGL